MAGRFRNLLAGLVGARTRFPPPVVRAGAEAAVLRGAIDAFHRAEPGRCRDLFLLGRPLRAARSERAWLDRFSRAGLVLGAGAGLYAPCVRLFPFEGRFVATDLLTHRDPDQVFSLMFEQVYLVRSMGAGSGEEVLEPCMGSGAVSLAAADRGARVTGTEISPRAVAFARFNEALGPGAAPLTIRTGSLFEPLPADRRYDRIVVNPPFELVPPGGEHFLHSHGGEDGLDVVRALLAGAPGRLAPAGRLEMITWSPGSADRARLTDLFREAFPDHRLTVHRLDRGPLGDHLGDFASRPGAAVWLRRLEREGLTHVHFLFLRSEPAAEPGVVEIDPVEEVEAAHAVADTWL